jgi:integrase
LSPAIFTPVSKDDIYVSPAVEHYIRHSLAEKTLKKYAESVRRFLAWGGQLPATDIMVAEFLSHHAGITSLQTMKHQLAAISKIHKLRGYADPTRTHLVKSVLRGIGRIHGVPIRTKKPLTKDILFEILESMEMSEIRDYRDKTLLLLGFAGAFRPAELMALDVEDLEIIPGGMKCLIRRSKNDVIGNGRTVVIPNGKIWCPIMAMNDWLDISKIESGRLLRGVGYQSNRISPMGLSKDAVAIIVRKWVANIGKSPDGYAGKSLRSGLVTSAFMDGIPTTRIMMLTGHTNEKTLMRYCRPPDSLSDHPSYSVL